MKYTKVFNGNQYITKFYVGHLTKWQRFCRKFEKYAKRTIVIGGIITAIGWAYVGGIMTKMATADTKIITVVSTSTPSVMQRIAQCESGNSQYNKQGQLLIHVNSDGSYDVGKYEINSVHNAEATKLGYDLTKESDNKAYAMYLYQNRGTGDWSSSSKCWSK